MNRIDIPTMAAQLNLLAEVFEKRPVSEKAALVWFDTLKDFPTEKVCSLLIGWPKTHAKFPTPAEVWKACNEIASADLERKSERDKTEVFSPSANPAHVQRMFGQMRKILSGPKRSPKDHWRHVLATKPQGSIGYRFAQEALKPKVVKPREEELAA